MKKTILIFVLAFALFSNAYSQDNKTVTITVNGSGSTQQEALQTALRNAIEQAFGTFISSNTTILNDELIKDEIVSVSSGNIQKYEILAEVQTPSGIWNNSVKTILSVDKLTSFCESKGVNVEFKGSLFALNVKQQILNEKNELKSIQDMRNILKDFFNHSFNYTISANQPTSVGRETWKVPIIIEGALNNNIITASDYFHNVLSSLACTQAEITTYNSLEKQLYYVLFKPIGGKGKLFALRNSGSLDEIIIMLDDLREAFMNFTIENGVELLDMSKHPTHAFGGSSDPYYDDRNGSICSFSIKSIDFRPVLTRTDSRHPYNESYSNFLGTFSRYRFQSPRLEQEYYNGRLNNYNPGLRRYIKKYFRDLKSYSDLYGRENYQCRYIAISFANLQSGTSKGIISFQNHYDINQIQNISEYKIHLNHK